MDPERFELCVAPCKGLDFSIEKSTLTDAFVWTQRDSNCVQPPVKGSTFSINKKSTLADAFVWTQRDSNCAQPPVKGSIFSMKKSTLADAFVWIQRDSNCAQPPVKGSTSQSIKKHPCGCFCVDPERFELSTFSMPLRRAPNCAMGPLFFRENTSLLSNGPGGIRTLDLFSAIEARSQLRYRPVLHPDFKNKHFNGLMQECQAFFGWLCYSPAKMSPPIFSKGILLLFGGQCRICNGSKPVVFN